MKRFPIILLAAVCLAVFSGPAVAQVGSRRSMGNLLPSDPTAARAIQGSYRFAAPPRVVMPYVAPPVEYRRPPYRLEPVGVPGPQTEWQFNRRFKWFYDPYEDRFYAYVPQTGLFHAVVPNY